MKKSIIICEGSTDYILLQYYMRKALAWQDVTDNSRQKMCVKNSGQKSRMFEKDGNELTIMASGGCSRIEEALEKVIQKDLLSPPDLSGVFQNVIVVTDRDEWNSDIQVLSKLCGQLNKKGITSAQTMSCEKWLQFNGKIQIGYDFSFRLLVLVIPFEETGAMESFLLKAVSDNDPYDKDIIKKCSDFVDAADPDKRYLTKRRYVTKAKFDAYFSVRTAAEQFTQRQNILKNIPWEEYKEINKAFQLFEDI